MEQEFLARLKERFQICSVPVVELEFDADLKDNLDDSLAAEIQELPELCEVFASRAPILTHSAIPAIPVTKFTNLMYTPEHPQLAAQICKWLGEALTQSTSIRGPWCLTNVIFDESMATSLSVCKVFMIVNMLRHYQRRYPVDLTTLGPKFSLLAPCFDLQTPNAHVQSSSHTTWTHSTCSAAGYNTSSLVLPDQKTLARSMLPIIIYSTASAFEQDTCDSLQRLVEKFEEGYFYAINPPQGISSDVIHWRVLLRLVCLHVCLLNQLTVPQTACFIQKHKTSVLQDFPTLAQTLQRLCCGYSVDQMLQHLRVAL